MPLDPAGIRLIQQRLSQPTGPRTLDVDAMRIIQMRNQRTLGGGMNDALVYSPGEIKAEADTVNALIQQLLLDVNASPKIPAANRVAFIAFTQEWAAFYRDHTGWFDRLWFSNAEKIGEFRKRAADWRKLLKGHGLKTSTPDDDPHAPGIDTSKIPWKWILIGGGGLVALYFLAKIVPAMFGGAMDEAEEEALAIVEAKRKKKAAKELYTVT